MNAATKKALVDAITAEVVAKVTLLLEEDGDSAKDSAKAADATCGATTQTGTACKNEAGACRHHKAAPKAKAPKAKTGTVLLGFTKGGSFAVRSSSLMRRLNIELPKRVSPESVSKAVKAAGYTPKVVPAAELPSGKLELRR